MQNFDPSEHIDVASPPAFLEEITPNDSIDLGSESRAINVAASGLVQVTTVGGSVGSVFVVAGVLFPLRIRRVWATGTTATGIRALY